MMTTIGTEFDRTQWLAARGGAHIFPTKPGLSYREYALPVDGSDWGEGLLDKQRFGDPGVKRFYLPRYAEAGGHAEILLFGTGHITGECSVNGRIVPKLTTGELHRGADIYPGLGGTVHRCYHLVPVPAGVLVRGENILKVAPNHAFIQAGVVRIFSTSPAEFEATLEVAEHEAGIALALRTRQAAEIHAVEFYARHAGLDLDLTGEDPSWQAALSADPRYPSHTRVRHNLASLSTAPWVTTVAKEGWPEGPVAVRARVILRNGSVVESAGGIVESDYQTPVAHTLVRAEGFRPFGFHRNGWQQEMSCECRYDLGAVTKIDSAELIVPCYGDVRMMLNGRRELSAGAPLSDYYIVRVPLALADLRSGAVNHLSLRASGGTGCFQPPGPCLSLSPAATRVRVTSDV